jgi:serine/threonine protein kinase
VLAGPEFPAVFGKYVLLREMARGGMGELFLAAAGEQAGLEKLCVVKTLLAATEDERRLRRRFFDEARVVVRLNHANLVQVFDVGSVEGELYLAMELVEGKDLRAVWNRCAQLQRRIPVDVAVFVVRELLRGLAYVHEAMGLGLVHRDISPPNILVGYRGEVKLTDFGLAKSALRSEITNPGRVFGRYNYLSPEQARGQPVDLRADIYAAGIVLWELLTGRQLFPASVAATRGARGRPGPAGAGALGAGPGDPRWPRSIVLRALATERDQRYQTADRFRASLSEILARNYPACDTDRVGASCATSSPETTNLRLRTTRATFAKISPGSASKAGGRMPSACRTRWTSHAGARRPASESRMADSRGHGLLSGRTAKDSRRPASRRSSGGAPSSPIATAWRTCWSSTAWARCTGPATPNAGCPVRCACCRRSTRATRR